MSDTGSIASTIPNTPEDVPSPTNIETDDAFALLQPLSNRARSAFDASVNRIIKHSGIYDHCRQFIRARRTAVADRSPLTDDDDGTTQEDLVTVQWNGEFRFSLREPPRDAKVGWHFGTGRGCPRGVDILLAPPTDKWKNAGLGGNHARLHLHPQSFRMVLHARHTVIVSQTLRRDEFKVLEDGDTLLINDCSYAFSYTSRFKSVDFWQEIQEYLRQTYESPVVFNRLLTPASVGTPERLGRYFQSPNRFAQGTFGQVTAGWSCDGSVVAIKHLKDPKADRVRVHEQLMHAIGHHPNVLQLLECISDFSTRLPRASYVYSPLTAMNMNELIAQYTVNTFATCVMMKDYLSGLSYLHQKGIMHRDIKPANLAIRSIVNPVGVILDLDAATASPASKDHMQGTIPYLAPEIIALKDKGSKEPPYDKRVDIWALGLSFYSLIQQEPWTWIPFSLDLPDRRDRFSDVKHLAFHQHVHQVIKFSESKEPGAMYTKLIKVGSYYDVGSRAQASGFESTA